MTLWSGPSGPRGDGAPPLRAAIVQLEAVHETVVPSVYEALVANGVEPTVFLNARILERGDLFSLYTDYADRVHYLPINTPRDWDALTAEVSRYDLLVLNTFQREGPALWAEQVGLPTIGVVHNPPMFMDQPTCVKLVRQGRAKVLSLAPHVTSYLMRRDPALFADAGTLAFWYWDMPEPESMPERRRIVIPGAVNFAGRDFAGVVDSLPAMVDEVGRDEFEIAIVGAGPDRDALHDLVRDRGFEDLFWFAPVDARSGFVDSKVFYDELKRSSFLLPMLPEGRVDYRIVKITSAVPSSVGFTVPAIIDRWTALTYDVPCVSYPRGQVLDGLRTAARMPADELHELHDDLAEHRTRSIERSAHEMGYALDALGRSATFPDPTIDSGEPPVNIDRDDRDAFLDFATRLLPTSYSQRFQDIWALWETGLQRNGYFVEFGALNGKDFSNTYLLEMLGWNGVVAEPHPDYAQEISKHRSCTISTKCVFDSTGDTVTFHAVKGRPALSSVEGFGGEDSRAHFREEYVAHDVETITLTDLLTESSAPAEVDFLSIDTEGSELRILSAFDFEKFQIRCISVEHNDVQRDALHDLLTSKGYRRKWEDLSGHDDWYVHESAYPDWSAQGQTALLEAAVQVEPFDRRYEERRDLLTSMLPTGANRPAAHSAAPVRQPPGVAPRVGRAAADAEYSFQANFHTALMKATGLSTEVVFKRVAQIYQRMCKRVKPTLALEIGAFEASWSTWMKQNVEDCRVIAFEANPHVHERFRDQVTATGVEYRHQAVGSESGTIQLKLPVDFRGSERPLDSQMASLHANRFTDRHQAVDVECVRLDDVIGHPERERIVAWIDVEGACEEVLTGSREVLSGALMVYIEVESRALWEDQWLDTDVARFFRDLGFTLVMRDQLRPTQFNLVFVRNDVARRPWVANRAARVYRPVTKPGTPATPAPMRSLPRRVGRRLLRRG
jgi:FkbM family methyltransferase